MLKPVEMLAMAPKSWETSNQAVARLHKQELTQGQLAYGLEKDIKHNSQRPIETTKSDQSEHRYKDLPAGSNGAFYEKPKKKKKKAVEPTSKEHKDTCSQVEGCRLDIRI